MAKLNLKSLYVSVVFFGSEAKNRLMAPLVGCTGKEAVEYVKALREVMEVAAKEDLPWLDFLQSTLEVQGSPEWVAVYVPFTRRIRQLGLLLNSPFLGELADEMEGNLPFQEEAWERRQGKMGGLEVGSLDEWIVRVAANRPVTAAEDLWTYLLEDIYNGAKFGERTLWDAYLRFEEYAARHGLDASCTALAGLKECCRIPYRV